MKRGRVAFYTNGLSEPERRLTGVENVASVEEAILESLARTDDKAIAVIPEGPYVIPFYAGE
jgi:nickel-dependent lactate racemase